MNSKSVERFLERFPIRPYDHTILPKPKVWVIECLWLKSRVNGFFGPEKAGKSRLMCWLLACLYSGKPSGMTFQMREKPKRILYLAGEEDMEDIVGRMQSYLKYLKAPALEDLPIDFMQAAGMGLESEQQRDDLEAIMISGKYDMLFIEPLRRVHNADENSNNDMARLMNRFRHWADIGITIVFCHHTGKADASRGVDMTRMANWGRGASDVATICDAGAYLQEIGKIGETRTLKLMRDGRFRTTEDMIIIDTGEPSEGKTGFRQDHNLHAI